jgi:hypothetical protein
MLAQNNRAWRTGAADGQAVAHLHWLKAVLPSWKTGRTSPSADSLPEGASFIPNPPEITTALPLLHHSPEHDPTRVSKQA